MNPLLTELIELLKLERLEDNLFRGISRDIGTTHVYGGQVLGQALSAAAYTVDEDRFPHSLHAYFLRAGDIKAPIVYEVDRSRDGRSFSARRVVAIQHGRPIFTMAASFQGQEEGIDHQAPMPDVPGPDGLEDSAVLAKDYVEKVPLKMRRFLMRDRPFEFRPVDNTDPHIKEPRPAVNRYWFRTCDTLPDDPALHRSLLAYVSDYNLLTTATLPHGLSFLRGNVQMASLDHAMWFHRPFRMDEWLLYAVDSPSASGARALTGGYIFKQDGTLVASTAQEGLIRVWEED